MRFLVKSLILVMVLLIHSIAWAAHPLITDDSGTQGKGKFQIEVNGQYDHEKETDAGVSVKETATEIGAILSYGILDHVDIVILELTLARAHPKARTLLEVANRMDEIGFRIFDQVGGWRVPATGEMEQLDLVFARKTAAFVAGGAEPG